MINPKQTKIIKLLLSDKRGFTAARISKILSTDLPWTYENLKQLENQGILKSEKKGNLLIFALNWKNPETEKICSLLIIDSEEASEIEKNIEISRPREKKSPEIRYSAVAEQQTQKYAEHSTYTSNSSYVKQNAQNVYAAANSAGEEGVSNLLSAYAQQGAFGSAQVYSTAQPSAPVVVPPNTIGSRISRNISGYNFATHSIEHRERVITGCRYCDSF